MLNSFALTLSHLIHSLCVRLCVCRDLGQGAYALSFVAAAAGSWSLDVSACGQTLSAIQFTVPVPIGTRCRFSSRVGAIGLSF